MDDVEVTGLTTRRLGGANSYTRAGDGDMGQAKQQPVEKVPVRHGHVPKFKSEAHAFDAPADDGCGANPFASPPNGQVHDCPCREQIITPNHETAQADVNQHPQEASGARLHSHRNQIAEIKPLGTSSRQGDSPSKQTENDTLSTRNIP
jgi:hypothetical protein